MSGIKIPVQAEFNPGDVQQAIGQFVQQFNQLGGVIAQANKVKFNPIDKASIEDLRRVNQQFDSLRKISGAMNQRMKATGQSGAGFFDVDWGRMYSDPGARAREMRKAFEYVTGHSFLTPSSPTGGAPTKPAAPPPPPPPPAPPPTPGAGWGGAGRRIAASGLGAMGPVGGAANNALSAGLAGGAMAGLVGLAGGLLALGVGKAVGATRERIGAAEQEFIGYDTLKRSLGDVNVGFETLKESLRAASDVTQVTFQEGQRVAQEFARIADMGPDAARTIAGETAIAGGFGRSLGVEPGSSGAFFAQMRLHRVTEDQDGSRRLALMIGEAVARSGAFAKTEELLQVIGGYAAQQTRLGLVSANVGGYASMLSGMIGSGIPGLDVEGSANILSHVNSAISRGGAAGEAGQHFMYAAIGRRLGLNPVQMRVLQEQGAFGTGASVFGQDGVYSQFSRRFGGSTPAAASMSETMTLPMLMEHFQKSYGGQPDLMADAMANFFGLSTSQAMALALQDPKALGGIEERLKRSGLDLSQMSYTGIAALGQIQSGGRDVLMSQASSLQGRTGAQELSQQERDRLQAAISSGDDEALRDVLTELTATREQERTEGSETRRTIVGVQNEVQRLSSALVPLMNDMRAGILYMAGDGGKVGPLAMAQAVARGESVERVSAIRARFDPQIKHQRGLAAQAQSNAAGMRHDKLMQAQAGQWANKPIEERVAFEAELDRWQRDEAAATARAAELEAERGAALGEEETRLKGEIDRLVEERTAALAGPTAATDFDAVFGSMLVQESGARHIDPATGGLVTNKSSGARGIAQIMPATGRDPGMGVKPLQNDTEQEHRRFAKDYLQALLRKYGGDRRKALAAYNWGTGNVDRAVLQHGDNWLSAAPKETRDYVPEVLARAGDMHGTPLPPGVKDGAGVASASVDVNVNVTGILNDPAGKPAGMIESSSVRTGVGIATPYGARS